MNMFLYIVQTFKVKLAIIWENCIDNPRRGATWCITCVACAILLKVMMNFPSSDPFIAGAWAIFMNIMMVFMVALAIMFGSRALVMTLQGLGPAEDDDLEQA